MAMYHCKIQSFLQLLLFFALILQKTTSSTTQLRHDYYRKTCPNVESIVRSAVQEKFGQTSVTAPATLRLFFHDCFVQGCDASVLVALRNNSAEKDNEINISLAGDGFDTVNKAKAAIDRVPRCKNKVSCADILAMATRDVIALTGGPSYAVELGRRDGRISAKANVENRLPHPEFSLKKLNSMFASHGLTQLDLIALSGAHTIGVSLCSAFSKRVHNFNKKHKTDPTINPEYAKQLNDSCPVNVDFRAVVPMDPNTPQQFDNIYYKNLQQGKGLFASDQSLFTNKRSRRYVNLFASNKTAFEHVFVAAITKLGRLGVKTGSQGEIRHDCTLVN